MDNIICDNCGFYVDKEISGLFFVDYIDLIKEKKIKGRLLCGDCYSRTLRDDLNCQEEEINLI